MKNICVFLITSISCIANAATPLEFCGQYQAQGEIAKNTTETGYSLVINQNTKSEYQLKFRLQDELKISSFVSKRVDISFLLSKKPSGMKAEIDKVLSIKKNPYNGIELSKKNEIELIKKSECNK